MTVKIKGMPVDLAGTVYVIPPLSLGALEAMQDGLSSVNTAALDRESTRTILDAAHAALKRNYPDLSREDVGNMIDVGNMGEVFEAIMDVSGLKRKALEAEGEGKPSTGESSTPT